MNFQPKYDIKELREYALNHTTNECAKFFNISYTAMAQLIYRYKLKHKVEQVPNYDRGTKLHNVWKAIKQRCTNSNNSHYYLYGGRGITLCKEWQGVYGYTNFKNWALTNGYVEGLVIDRIDNNKGYCPSNCRWITNKENQNNKRTNVYVTYKNETLTLSQWAEKLNIPYGTLNTRHQKGYSDKEIIEGMA